MFCWHVLRGQSGVVWRKAVLSVLFCLFLSLHTVPAFAMKIQEVVSPKGIKAWLVEDHTLPLLAMQFGFRGGTAQDPAGKEGLTYFISTMLDEGAGDLKSQEFAERMENLAINMSFEAARDSFTGGIRTLTKNRAEAFRLLHTVLTAPRMDQDAVERMREAIVSSIKMENEDPEKISTNAWFRMVFDGHPYANTVKGNPSVTSTITSSDLKAQVKRLFARDVLYVSVVGDITPEELGKALDEVFGDLPAKADLKVIPEAEWHASKQNKIISVNVPQSVVTFGQPGLKRKDPDYIPAYILNYIIGGGGFSSILMQEVREKRGLAYSVYTYLYPLDRAGILLGGVATENKAVKQSIDVIRTELQRIASVGPTEEELENAKRYLTGSYVLHLDSSPKIAATLLGLQFQELGVDYMDRRQALFEKVTIDDIRRVAARLIKPDALTITIVGQPEGLTDTADTPKETKDKPANGKGG
jgi:zinc protease